MKLHFYAFPVSNIMVFYSVKQCGLLISKYISENHVAILNVEVEIEIKPGFFFLNVGTMKSISEEPQNLRILFFKKEDF
jgi:hypothetical protein